MRFFMRGDIGVSFRMFFGGAVRRFFFLHGCHGFNGFKWVGN